MVNPHFFGTNESTNMMVFRPAISLYPAEAQRVLGRCNSVESVRCPLSKRVAEDFKPARGVGFKWKRVWV